MEIPRHWRLKKQRYSLIGEECPHCDAVSFPKRDVCQHCGGISKSMQDTLNKQKYSTVKQGTHPETNIIYSSVEITNPTYYRESEDQFTRDIINYSDYLKPEIEIPEFAISDDYKQEVEIKQTETIIYQAAYKSRPRIFSSTEVSTSSK